MRRLFEVNSEPHTGARPSVRLCVGLKRKSPVASGLAFGHVCVGVGVVEVVLMPRCTAKRCQGPIKPPVFLVSTKRAFYLIGVPVGSGVGCEEGTAEGAAECGGEGSSEGEKLGPANASAWL